MKIPADWFFQGKQSGTQNDEGNGHRRDVLDASMAEGMLFVGFFAGQFSPGDGKNRWENVCQIVDRIKDNGDGIWWKPDNYFKDDEYNITADPFQTGWSDASAAGCRLFIKLHENPSFQAVYGDSKILHWL